MENRKKDTEKREIPWKEIGGCMTGAGVGLLILAARIWGYLPQIPFWLILSVMVSFMGIGTLAAVLLERKETRNAEIVYNQRSTPMQKSEDSFSQVGSVGAKGEDNELLGETVVLSSGNVYGPSTLVSKEPGELATIYLNEDLTVIGKLENAADAVINLPTVSRMHAKIRKREGEYYLTDLNSRNGTAVNGQMLKPEEDYLLQDQDEVDFAQARYIFIKIG